jgi:DNA repair exonuclease SbcCD ATPase subunit
MKRYKADAAKIKDEENPHAAIIESTTNAIKKHRDTIPKIEQEIEQETYLNRHYWYIYKAYHDRTKIKSFVFQDHVPFINSRLRHYLDVFGLDVQIELTPALGITSNMWGYEFESGGEKKRTDVAFMLAMFDFHQQMYGRQCNLLVLDEVDGRLDDDGIDSLINIIKNDLAPRVDTVLIISHRNMMRDTFPRELHVTRTNRFSQITEAT